MRRDDTRKIELELGQLVQGGLDRPGHDLNTAGQAGGGRDQQGDGGGLDPAGRGDLGHNRGRRRLAGFEHADDCVGRPRDNPIES